MKHNQKWTAMLTMALLLTLSVCTLKREKKESEQESLQNLVILMFTTDLLCTTDAIIIEGLLKDEFGQPVENGLVTTSHSSAISEFQQARTVVGAPTDESGYFRVVLSRSDSDINVTFQALDTANLELGSFDLDIRAASLGNIDYVPEPSNVTEGIETTIFSISVSGTSRFAALGMNFTDADENAGQIGGTLSVTRAEEETTITHYTLYWGADSVQLAGQEAIAELAKTGSDVTYTFSTDTTVPAGATEVLVFTKNSNCEMAEGVALAFQDNTLADATDSVPADPIWQSTGSAGFSSGKVQKIVMAGDPSGVPYVAFRDQANSGMATVMKYDVTGDTWQLVGDAGFSAGVARGISMAIDSSGVPHVAYRDLGNSGMATVMRYDSTSNAWQALGSAGFSAGTARFVSIALDASDTPYVIYRDEGNSSGATVMRYNSGGSAWEALGNVSFSAGKVQNTTLGFDSAGELYVAYRDKTNGYGATVMHYNTGSSAWELTGAAGFSAGKVRSVEIAFDANDTPYVAYRDIENGRAATVMSYDSGSSAWVVVGTAGFSEGKIGRINLSFDANGVAYVAYRDDANHAKATIMSYDTTGGVWSAVGSAGFSQGRIRHPSIIFGANNVLYIAYKDKGNGKRATAMRFE